MSTVIQALNAAANTYTPSFNVVYQVATIAVAVIGLAILSRETGDSSAEPKLFSRLVLALEKIADALAHDKSPLDPAA